MIRPSATPHNLPDQQSHEEDGDHDLPSDRNEHVVMPSALLRLQAYDATYKTHGAYIATNSDSFQPHLATLTSKIEAPICARFSNRFFHNTPCSCLRKEVPILFKQSERRRSREQSSDLPPRLGRDWTGTYNKPLMINSV